MTKSNEEGIGFDNIERKSLEKGTKSRQDLFVLNEIFHYARGKSK